MVLLRKTFEVVRVGLPSLRTDDHYFGLVLLYYHYRSWLDIIGDFPDAKSVFMHHQKDFDQSGLLYSYMTPAIDTGIKAVQLASIRMMI